MTEHHQHKGDGEKPELFSGFKETQKFKAGFHAFAFMVRWLAFCNLILLAILPVRAELIPAARLVPWTNGIYTGVFGGIPTDRTNIIDLTAAPYGLDKTGVTNIYTGFQQALDDYNKSACCSSNVLYFPAGTYLLNTVVTMNNSEGQLTIRGAGTNTIINVSNTTGFIQVIGAWDSTSLTITNGLAKGSTNIGMADTTTFTAGRIALITIENDGAIPEVPHTYGYTNGMRRQIVRVDAKTATTLTVWPPLYDTYTNASIKASLLQPARVGVEDMLINSTNAVAGGYTIYFSVTDNCWVKNVKSLYAVNYHVFVQESLNWEVRDSWLDRLQSAGANGAGLLVNTCSGGLFENSIIYRAFPLIEVNHGSSGNVFGYNYLKDSEINGVVGSALMGNHGPWNQFNLYEGNVAPNYQSDGYFGGSGNDTLFRNWFHGVLTNATDDTRAIKLNRLARNYSIVANVLGQTNYTWFYSNTNGATAYTDRHIYSFGLPYAGNGSFSGYAPPWTGNQGTVRDMTNALLSTFHDGSTLWATSSIPVFEPDDATNTIYRVFIFDDGRVVRGMIYSNLTTVRLLDEGAVLVTNAHFKIAPGPNGFQELDTNVAATVLLKGNWNYADNGTNINESLLGDVVPDSYYRASEPSWYGTNVWPAHPIYNAAMLAPIPAETTYAGVGNSGGTSAKTGNGRIKNKGPRGRFFQP